MKEEKFDANIFANEIYDLADEIIKKWYFSDENKDADIVPRKFVVRIHTLSYLLCKRLSEMSTNIPEKETMEKLYSHYKDMQNHINEVFENIIEEM